MLWCYRRYNKIVQENFTSFIKLCHCAVRFCSEMHRHSRDVQFDMLCVESCDFLFCTNRFLVPFGTKTKILGYSMQKISISWDIYFKFYTMSINVKMTSRVADMFTYILCLYTYYVYIQQWYCTYSSTEFSCFVFCLCFLIFKCTYTLFSC